MKFIRFKHNKNKHEPAADDYLTLADGSKVRLLWNLNSMADFYRNAAGGDIKSIEKIPNDLHTLLKVAWYAAKEGEAAEGRKFNLSERDLGSLVQVGDILKLAQIISGQSVVVEAPESRPTNIKFSN